MITDPNATLHLPGAWRWSPDSMAMRYRGGLYVPDDKVPLIVGAVLREIAADLPTVTAADLTAIGDRIDPQRAGDGMSCPYFH